MTLVELFPLDSSSTMISIPLADSTTKQQGKPMKSLIVLSLVASALILSACAKRAELIEPAAISTVKYEGWSCSKLRKEKAFVENALVQKSATQDRAATNDAWMVFLIGVPTSGGGISGEIARLKGENEALRQAMVARGCR